MSALAAVVSARASTNPVPLYRFSAPPANDNFADAQVINADVWVTGTFVGSTVESIEFESFASIDGGASLRASQPYTVWYKIIPPRDDDGHLEWTSDLGPYGFYSLASITSNPPASGSASLANIVATAIIGSDSSDEDNKFPARAGIPVYIQLLQSVTDQPDDQHMIGDGTGYADSRGLADFQIRVSFHHPPPVLAGEAYGSADVEATMDFSIAFEAIVEASSTAVAEDSINSSYADVHAGATVVGFLQLDANPFITPYVPPNTAGFMGGGDLPSAPAVSLAERVGPVDQDRVKLLGQDVNLLGADAHSTDLKGFADAPIPGASTHSMERWLQVRVQPPFNSFAGLRVWMLDTLLPGWTLKYGVAEDYAAPTSAASAVATAVMPTADPGALSPNVLTAPLIDGDHDQAAPWLVLQLELNPSAAKSQPIGYAPEVWSVLPIHLQLAWTET